MDLSHILFAIIGMLMGLGGMSLWVKKSADDLAVKMRAVEKDIERLDRFNTALSNRMDDAMKIHAESQRVFGQLAEQNNFLIQKLLAKNAD